ncbi:hypothetical protein KIPB_007600, partial [Kipferlia bialata]
AVREGERDPETGVHSKVILKF